MSCLIAFASLTSAAQGETIQMREDFSSDPGWQGINNVPAPSSGVTKVQDFGYSATSHASETPGEIGGRILRSLTPATYLKPVSIKALNDSFAASGRFSVTQSSGGSGVLIGWFNHASRGWRTPNSLALCIEGESGKFRLFFEYGTRHWKTGGGDTFKGRYQTTKTPMHAAESPAGTEIPHFNIRTAPASEPVDLLPGPHLFVDEYLIAKSENLKRTIHPPQRYEGNPILGVEQGTTQPYVSVIRDPDTKRYRMWYNRDIGPGCTVAYAESDDAIHWRTPSLGIFGDDNRLFPVAYGAAVLDEGPAFADKSRRFKLAWWDRAKPGMNVAFSPDGLHWTAWESNPVLEDLGEEKFIGDPRRSYGVSDIIDVYWDPIRKHYGAFLKSPAVPSDGLAGGARGFIPAAAGHGEPQRRFRALETAVAGRDARTAGSRSPRILLGRGHNCPRQATDRIRTHAS
jgi:hypothetical protein